MTEQEELQQTIWRIDDVTGLIEIAVSDGRPIAVITGPFVWALLRGLRWLMVKILERISE